MAATMSDRGPDATGSWAQDGIALAHRRLKIIDLSERACQPMVDSQLGLAIAFNGCIYNHRDLRAELERVGYAFFSKSDTEVLLKAYHHWGEEFVDRLKGMFAMAIAERDSGDLVLVRDRLGVKPLTPLLAEIGGIEHCGHELAPVQDQHRRGPQPSVPVAPGCTPGGRG